MLGNLEPNIGQINMSHFGFDLCVLKLSLVTSIYRVAVSDIILKNKKYWAFASKNGSLPATIHFFKLNTDVFSRKIAM